MRYKFVDQILGIDDKGIKGKKCVSLNEDIFRDHFEFLPILPAAVMVEVAVELARYFVWEKTDCQRTILPITYDRFKFYREVTPGESLEVHNIFENYDVLSSSAKVNIEGSVNGDAVLTGQIVFKTCAFEKLHDKKYATCQMKMLQHNGGRDGN